MSGITPPTTLPKPIALMNSPAKNITLGVFVLASLLLGALAVHQNQRLQELGQQLAKLSADRDTVTKQAKETAQRLATAESDLAATEAELKKTTTAAASAPRPASGERRRDPAAMMAMMDNPSMQNMMATSIKGSLDQRYSALFKKLKLSPASLEKLKELLTERQLSSMDVMRAAASQGLNPMTNKDEIEKMINSAQGESDERIKDLLGSTGYEQFQDFSQNIGSYGLLDQIERRLSFTDNPVASNQSEALLRALIQTTKTPSGGPMMGFVQGIAGNNPMFSAMSQPQITEQTIAAAQSVLNSSQIEVLKQLQAEQQAQKAAMQAMRSSGKAPPPPGP